MKMYLVTIYRDQTGDEVYCVDDNYYCGGLYTSKELAKKRVEIENELNPKTGPYYDNSKAEIIEIEVDKDYHVKNYDGDGISYGDCYCGEIWLGGGCYIE